MCPGTSAITAAVAGLAGGATTAVGGIEQGQATANAANYAAQVAQNNATIANQNATYATAAGQTQAANQSLKGAATAGRIKASQAASGIDVNTGSALNVQEGQREQSQLDTETVLNNAELQAYGYRSQAMGFTAQSGLESQEAEEAPIGGALNATGDLLSSASSVGLKYGGTGGGTPAFTQYNAGNPIC